MIAHWLYRWIWLDFYVPVWPNIVAAAICTAALWLKLHAIHKLHKEHFAWHKNQGNEGDQDAGHQGS